MLPFISFGQDPRSPAVEIEFLTPALLSASEHNIGRIRASNTASHPLEVKILSITGSIQARSPMGQEQVSIQPGNEKFLPVYLKIPAGNTDSVHRVKLEIQVTLQDTTWVETISRQLKAEKVSRLICTIPDEDILLNEERREAHLRLRISNRGNTSKNIIVELENAKRSMTYSPVTLSVIPGADTVLSWNKIATYRQLIGGEQHYYLTVKDQVNESQVYFYQLIRVRSPGSSSQPYSQSLPSNTIGLRYEQWGDMRYFNMTGNGRMQKAIGDYGIDYRFDIRKHPYHDMASIDQLKLMVQNEKNTFSLGDIYLGQETGLYNRGIQAEVNLRGNVFLNGAYMHSGLMPSTFYNSRNEETIAAGARIEGSKQSGILKYIYQNDRLVNTNTHLLFAGNTRKLGENGVIESGVGLSAERFRGKTEYDGAAFLNVNYSTPKWELSSDNRYSGSAYPFINRGDTHFRQLFTYKPSGNVHYHAEALVQRFSPRYRYLSTSSTTSYRNTRGALGVRFYRPDINYSLSAGAGTNQLFAPYLNNNLEYEGYEVFLSGDIHFIRPHLSMHLKQKVSRVIPRLTNTPAYYAGTTELNAVLYDTYFSFYLNKGAFTFFDQANYVLNGFTRDFFLARIFRKFYMRPDLSIKITADHYRDQAFDYHNSTFGIAPEFTYKSFKFNYEAGYRITNGREMFLQSLSVFKNFENPLERKYTLQVQTFNDTNGNGVKDPGEAPVEGVLLGMGPLRMVTGANGFSELKNLPREKYEILLLDKRSFSSNRNRFEVLLGSSQTIAIPLYEGVELTGRVESTEDKLPAALNSLIIRVANTETGEHAFLPCDHKGQFSTVLPKGNSYKISIAPSTIPQGYVAEPDERIINTAGPAKNEVIFTLKQETRNVIRKQFGSLD